MMKRSWVLAIAIALTAAACSDDSTDVVADEPTVDETAPVTGPSSIDAIAQAGDGTSVVVASIVLPTDGFIVIHGDNSGAPGPVIGHSDLLPAGESIDVVVPLDVALGASGMVFPMAHVDANANGVYEFTPPDDATDVPATTADGAVAVLGIDYTVGDVIALATTDLGDHIVDGAGNTLYLFVPDGQGDSVCYDECEANWPVVGPIVAVGDGLDASLLGTIERTTGDVQATYNSWPLYYFIADAAPGETNGQGVNDVWYVVDPSGEAIAN